MHIFIKSCGKIKRRKIKLLKHVFALSLPIIYSKNSFARYARSVAFYPPLKKCKHAMCFTNPIYIFFNFLVSLSLTATFQNSLRTCIKLHKIAYKMSKNCLRLCGGGGGRKWVGRGVVVRLGSKSTMVVGGDRRPW